LPNRRICIIIGSEYPHHRGGNESLFTDLGNALIEHKGWKTVVLARKPRKLKRIVYSEPLPTLPIPTLRTLPVGRLFDYVYTSFFDQMYFGKRIAMLSGRLARFFDVIITPDPIITKKVTSKRRRPRIIQFVGGLWAENTCATQPLLGPIARRIEAEAYKAADCTVFMDQILAQRFRASSIQSTIISNGVDTSRFDPTHYNRSALREKLGIANKIMVTTVATLRKEIKGLEYLLDAIPSVIEQYPECEFFIIGKGEQGWLRKQAQSLGIVEHIHLLGERLDIPELLTASDQFVLPSLSEGTPGALLEAMAMELPSIATRVGGIPDIITHQKDGFLIKPGKPDEISSAIIHLLSHPKLAKELSKNARNRIRTKYSIEKTVDEYIALIERLCQ